MANTTTLTTAETYQIVIQFYGECQRHWHNDKKRLSSMTSAELDIITDGHKIVNASAHTLSLMALNDVKNLKRNPYKPMGELLCNDGKHMAIKDISTKIINERGAIVK